MLWLHGQPELNSRTGKNLYPVFSAPTSRKVMANHTSILPSKQPLTLAVPNCCTNCFFNFNVPKLLILLSDTCVTISAGVINLISNVWGPCYNQDADITVGPIESVPSDLSPSAWQKCLTTHSFVPVILQTIIQTQFMLPPSIIIIIIISLIVPPSIYVQESLFFAATYQFLTPNISSASIILILSSYRVRGLTFHSVHDQLAFRYSLRDTSFGHFF